MDTLHYFYFRLDPYVRRPVALRCGILVVQRPPHSHGTDPATKRFDFVRTTRSYLFDSEMKQTLLMRTVKWLTFKHKVANALDLERRDSRCAPPEPPVYTTLTLHYNSTKLLREGQLDPFTTKQLGDIRGLVGFRGACTRHARSTSVHS